MSRHLFSSYVPVSTGAGLKVVPFWGGHAMWRSNQIGQPMLPMEMGGGINWDKVWATAEKPALEKFDVNTVTKAIEYGLKKLGLGVGDGDDVFSEMGTAMRSRRRR
jgi:hypothetical protein